MIVFEQVKTIWKQKQNSDDFVILWFSLLSSMINLPLFNFVLKLEVLSNNKKGIQNRV